MTTQLNSAQALRDSVRAIARDVAAKNAAAVDQEGRFPIETIDALRDQRALSALVPLELGGGGIDLETVAQCCTELGRCCASSAMVFAMHQIKVITLVRHLESGSWFEGYLSELASDQRLVASVTTEIGTGGDMGRSIAAVTPGGDGSLSFEKRAPVVSYGAYADDLFTTLRRAPDAEPGDQVVALTRKEQNELEPAGVWDVLGMRGTCSPGYLIRAPVRTQQVMWTPFSKVAAESMVPASHILWSHLWLGIAEDAVDRARGFVRAQAKRKPGEPLPVAIRLSSLLGELTLLRAEVASGLRDFTSATNAEERDALNTVAAALRFNNLKIATSEQTVQVCRDALEVTGIMGYRNDSPFSVGRHLRDSLSGPLMIANDRIHDTNAGLLLIAKDA